jgi:hypothetical protein
MNQSGPTRHGDPGRPTPTPRPGTRPGAELYQHFVNDAEAPKFEEFKHVWSIFANWFKLPGAQVSRSLDTLSHEEAEAYEILLGTTIWE